MPAMPMKEEITWVAVEEGLPAEQDMDDVGEDELGDDVERFMTMDEEGDVLFQCYREGGMWMTEDGGYTKEVECEVVAWAPQPKGPASLRARRN
jgi:hypothetical protein